MKKLFTVLAVLLVASVAFAATFSGSATGSYKFDFDAKAIADGNPGIGSMDVAFSWDTGEVVVGGESDVHVDFKAVAEFNGFYNYGNNHAPGFKPFYKPADANKAVNYDYGTLSFMAKNGSKELANLTLKIATFKIVGKDWVVDLLGKVTLDFAKSAIDSKTFNDGYAEENTQAYSFNNTPDHEQDLAVTFKGYKVGFGIDSASWDKALNFTLGALTPEYDFNGVKAQAGALYIVKNNDWSFAGSAKASYATDTFSVGGAYDAQYVGKDEYLYNDLAVNFGFAPVTVDVYFNNDGAQAKDKYYDQFDYDVADPADHVATFGVSNYFSAKVVVDVAKVAENVPVTVTLTGKKLFNAEKQNLSVAAETTVVPNFKFGAYFNDWFDQASDHRKLGATVEFTGVQNLTLNAEVAYAFAKEDGNKKFFGLVGAEYAHELFTASAEIGMEKVYNQDAKFGADATVKSTKLVDGAELSAKALFNLNDLHDTIDVDQENSLKLACKVSF